MTGKPQGLHVVWHVFLCVFANTGQSVRPTFRDVSVGSYLSHWSVCGCHVLICIVH